MKENEVSEKMRFIELLVLSGTLIYTLGSFSSDALMAFFSVFIAVSILYFALLIVRNELENGEGELENIYKPLGFIIGGTYSVLLSTLVTRTMEGPVVKAGGFLLYFLVFGIFVSVGLLPRAESRKLLEKIRVL
jgi:hypothetical protein